MRWPYVAGWIACSVLAYGIGFAWYTRGCHGEEKHEDDRDFAGLTIAMGLLLGPVALVMFFFTSGFARKGMRFKWW